MILLVNPSRDDSVYKGRNIICYIRQVHKHYWLTCKGILSATSWCVHLRRYKPYVFEFTDIFFEKSVLLADYNSCLFINFIIHICVCIIQFLGITIQFIPQHNGISQKLWFSIIVVHVLHWYLHEYLKYAIRWLWSMCLITMRRKPLYMQHTTPQL